MNVSLNSWNVNGIRAVSKKDDFCNWFRNDSGDIVCLQETKAQLEQIPKKLYNPKSFDAYFTSAERKGYSGVACYSKLPVNKVHHGMGIERFDSEGRFLRLDFDDFILMNIYYPNGGMGDDRLSYKLDFYDAFLDYVLDLKEAGNNLVICGDFNTAHKEIDIARPKENENNSGFMPIEREWMDKFVDAGFIDTFRLFNNEPENYTWWSYRTRARSRNVGWRLDYFFVNEEFKNNVKSSTIENNVMGSDHCPITLEIEL